MRITTLAIIVVLLILVAAFHRPLDLLLDRLGNASHTFGRVTAIDVMVILAFSLLAVRLGRTPTTTRRHSRPLSKAHPPQDAATSRQQQGGRHV